MVRAARLAVLEAERTFPVRVKIAVPPGGLGQRLDAMHQWLDGTCGADGWVMTPAGISGVANHAVAVHFRDPALASAFVARWCVANRVKIAAGVFQVREDAPAPRVPVAAHKTP